MIDLIFKHKEEFVDSCMNRRQSSVHNKFLHTLMINAIADNDAEAVAEMLARPSYRKPLYGVVYCMDCDFETKNLFVDMMESLND